jgi:hypothetical protein
MRLLIFSLLALTICWKASAQEENPEQLLNNMRIQFECTEAVDSMYNFKFEAAEKQFVWLRQQYPEHPLPYFLMGLSQWWKIMPYDASKEYDDDFFAYMDSSITKARKLYKQNKENPEAAFFLAAAYGFKARRLSDHGNYVKAGVASKASLNFMNEYKGDEETYGPEFLFGTALYNYFRVWIPENMSYLKPILLMFPKGDKQLGLDQLKKVSNEAFYTRVEAQVFLMRIYANYEDTTIAAFPIAKYLHGEYPDNAYFHRYYVKTSYKLGKGFTARKSARSLLARVEAGQVGYENESGRIATYILGTFYKETSKTDSASYYYNRSLEYGKKLDALHKGYCLSAYYFLGHYAKEEKQYGRAKWYFEKYYDLVETKKSAKYKVVKRFLKEHKKTRAVEPDNADLISD